MMNPNTIVTALDLKYQKQKRTLEIIPPNRFLNGVNLMTSYDTQASINFDAYHIYSD